MTLFAKLLLQLWFDSVNESTYFTEQKKPHKSEKPDWIRSIKENQEIDSTTVESSL